ncbi:MAG: hypothetical protein LBD98_03140 [Endomicrobium sp.]|jgi:hypothetical protein|nr:hypothetical protein [Endomicrobium sp.]
MNIEELSEILRRKQNNPQTDSSFSQAPSNQYAPTEQPVFTRREADRKKEKTSKGMLDHLIKLMLSKDTKKGQQLYGNIGRQNY